MIWMRKGNPAREPRTDTCREVQVAPLDYSNALDLSLNHALDLTAKTQVSLYSVFSIRSWADVSDTVNSLIHSTSVFNYDFQVLL